jgi:hypothetical protein
MISDKIVNAHKAAFIEKMALECAARHHSPPSTVKHPAGVIVPDNPFMTEKIQDPDYVPYCGHCSLMQRIRRTEYGFRCPGCGDKSNFDLTKFNGNVAVSYVGQPLSIGAWNAEVDRKKALKNNK